MPAHLQRLVKMSSSGSWQLLDEAAAAEVSKAVALPLLLQGTGRWRQWSVCGDARATGELQQAAADEETIAAAVAQITAEQT